MKTCAHYFLYPILLEGYRFNIISNPYTLFSVTADAFQGHEANTKLVTKALPQDVAFLAFVPRLRRRAFPLGSFELLLAFTSLCNERRSRQLHSPPSLRTTNHLLYQVMSSKTKREIAYCNSSLSIKLFIEAQLFKLPALPIRGRIVLRCKGSLLL